MKIFCDFNEILHIYIEYIIDNWINFWNQTSKEDIGTRVKNIV